MRLGSRRTLILLTAMVAAGVAGHYLWNSAEHNSLLGILWKFSFVAALGGVISFQIWARYSPLLDHASLSKREFARLRSLISKRQSRIIFLIVFGSIVSALTAVSTLMEKFPKIADFYFPVTIAMLVGELVLVIYTLLTLLEVEHFKAKLVERSREEENRKRLLGQLSDAAKSKNHFAGRN